METTLLDRGFVQAWSDGARQWRDASAQKTASLIPVRDAWAVYEPTWFGSSEQDAIIRTFPSTQTVASRTSDAMRQFVEREVGPMVRDLEGRIAARPSPALTNRLGAIYARYGIYDKAETAFREAARTNHVAAIHNLGNLHYLRGDFRSAATQYERAHALNPDSAEVAAALSRVRYEMEQFDQAREMFRVVQILDPKKAEGIAYVAGAAGESGRAADAASRRAVEWTE